MEQITGSFVNLSGAFVWIGEPLPKWVLRYLASQNLFSKEIQVTFEMEGRGLDEFVKIYFPLSGIEFKVKKPGRKTRLQKYLEYEK